LTELFSAFLDHGAMFALNINRADAVKLLEKEGWRFRLFFA
jgi:hypothetical protein